METKFTQAADGGGSPSLATLTINQLTDDRDRLKAINAELVTALQAIVGNEGDQMFKSPTPQQYELARAALAKSISSEWSVEYRREAGGWELKQGSAHRGIYRSEDEARLEIARLGG